MKSPYLTTAELAALFKKSVATVSNWCSSGRIEGAFKDPGGNWLIPADSVSINPPPPVRKPPPPVKPSEFAGLSPVEIVKKLHKKVTFHPTSRIAKNRQKEQDNREELLTCGDTKP